MVFPRRRAFDWPSAIIASHLSQPNTHYSPHRSRQAIKKYVTANNKITFASQGAFDAQFNKAIKAGVEKGEFTQPKGKFYSPSHRAHHDTRTLRVHLPLLSVSLPTRGIVSLFWVL